MDFLNVGGLELLFLLALTVVLVGPQKAVELTNQIARFVAGVRRTVNSVKADFQEELDQETEGLRQVEREVRSTVQAETQTFRDARQALREAERVAEESLEPPAGKDRPAQPTTAPEEDRKD